MPALAMKDLQRGSGDVGGALQSDAQCSVEHRCGNLLETPISQGGSRVHDGIDRPERLESRGEGIIHRSRVGDVGRDGQACASRRAALTSSLVQALHGPGYQHDTGPLGSQLKRCRPADPAGRSDNDDGAGTRRTHGVSTTLTQPSCLAWKIS